MKEEKKSLIVATQAAGKPEFGKQESNVYIIINCGLLSRKKYVLLVSVAWPGICSM